jgi:hypothetical protein
LALASAMPLDPPVMTATFPSSFPIIAPFVMIGSALTTSLPTLLVAPVTKTFTVSSLFGQVPPVPHLELSLQM